MGLLNYILQKLGRPLRSKAAPQLVFSQFQDVLKSNNRALEIIADLGEKGSGDYIFDQHYIDQAMQELHVTVAGSITALNNLCANSYPGLSDTLKRLQADLDQILHGSGELDGPFVQNFDDHLQADWGRVGGKAGHLVELRREVGIEVPPGFVITVPAFYHLIDYLGLRRQYDEFRNLLADGADENRLESLRAALVESISLAKPSAELLQAIKDALRDLGKDVPEFATLAVRSSALEEDQDFSFAGQFHSELNVKMEAESVSAAYLLVVASLFSESALLYHQHILPGEGNLAIAACCQIMVASKVSGVAYTLDPGSPLDELMAIVGAWGYGAAIVEGQIATDTFRVSKTTPCTVVSREIASKKQGLLLQADGGLDLNTLPADIKNIPCLTDQQ